MLGGAHEQPADVAMPAQGWDQLGMALLDLLERQAPLLLHQVDEPQVPRPQDDGSAVGHVVLGALGRAVPGRLVDRVPDHRVLLVAVEEVGHLAAGQRPLHELVEPVAVALLERRALRLPVVGEDDELIRPRGVSARVLDATELLVELAQRLERVRSLQAGVMRDLVVAREGRIDRRPPTHHVCEDAEHDQVAHDHAHHPAQERIDAAAVPARSHVAAGRPQRGGPLQQPPPTRTAPTRG